MEIAVGGKFYLKEYVEDESTFMFCNVSETQEHLIIRNGNISLLDAMYKTTKYALPLFLIIVKGNVWYIVVGVFIVQIKNSSAIVCIQNLKLR